MSWFLVIQSMILWLWYWGKRDETRHPSLLKAYSLDLSCFSVLFPLCLIDFSRFDRSCTGSGLDVFPRPPWWVSVSYKILKHEIRCEKSFVLAMIYVSIHVIHSQELFFLFFNKNPELLSENFDHFRGNTSDHFLWF